MNPPTVAVVGGGPAGLRAAEVLAQSGCCRVELFEQKPSVGRKFLVAGRGGLNLTHSEPLENFIARYEEELPRWRELLADFGPTALRDWAEGLGIETYVGTSGRVFPRGQQAAALLRRWVARLRESGVAFHVNRRFAGLHRLEDGTSGWALDFQDARSGEPHRITAHAAIFAMGGASWPQTGSDGRWTPVFQSAGIHLKPWQAANCGFEVDWDERFLAVAEGLPLKNIALTANGKTVFGEALVTHYSLEGGAVYQLGRRLRAMPEPCLLMDLKPAFTAAQLLAKLSGGGKLSFAEIMRRWRLGPAAMALLEFHGPGAEAAPDTLAGSVKRFPLALRGPRPIAEAISSAGGVAWSELTRDLMLARMPGMFAAGEMIDWEAPTGGYLLQGCFATGTRAAEGAWRFLQETTNAAASPQPL